MSKPKVFEKPAGVRDYLPATVSKLRAIESNVLNCMSQWGYREIITPTLEYFDTVGMASSISEEKMFKLLDRKGNALVMRSDMTAPIARVIGSLLQQATLPIRLSYHANVFRAMEEESGRDAEFFQTGVELVGDSTADADAEIIALAIASIRSAGVEQFNITMGHVGFLNGWFSETLPNQIEAQLELKQCLQRRDHVGFRHVLSQLKLDADKANKLESVLRLRGGSEVCERARSMTSDLVAVEAINHLCEVIDVLKAYGVSEHVRLDLTMISDFSYYTGMLFEGYAVGHGFPIASGGRYDNLLGQFGRPAKATGFALKTNRILEVVEQDICAPVRRVLIVYDVDHREQALQQAHKLRSQQDVIVEVCRWEAMTNYNELNETKKSEETGMYGKYDEILQFRGSGKEV